MKEKMCAVCGKMKTRFGNGIQCPKTTCVDCFKLAKLFEEEKFIMNVRRIVHESS